MKKILFIPDTHAPFHDKDAWFCMLKAATYFKPDMVVCLGDLIDLATVSAWSKSPEVLRMRYDEEIYAANLLVSDLEELAQERVFIEGNHETRLRRTIDKYVPAISGRVSIRSDLGLDNWEYVPYGQPYQLGDTKVVHDVGRAGETAVRMSGDDLKENIIIGHVHRMEIVYRGKLGGGKYFAACFGWLGDVKHVTYMDPAKTAKWRTGFGVGYLIDGKLSITGVPIDDGKCVLEGKEF